ncbi:MAG TPA: nucleoside hydrolase [Pseudolysinimonas sp.]|nr:nucleoside hydrolase [Pseudolysinimonas sp.]
MTTGDPIPIILDVDTGVDDALALIAAVRHPGLDLLAVSCVTGNAALDRVVDNTLRVLDAAGAPADIPVAAGAVRPLLAPPRSAGHVHGEDGLAGIVLPETSRVPEPGGAIEMLRRVILGHPQKVTIVALAPQTNLALLLRIHPEVAANIERIVFMGGSSAIGNATAVAEFNVWHDPEAAAAVLGSGIPCLMYGLDVFMKVAIDEAQAAGLASLPDAGVALAGRLLSHRIAFSADEEAVYSGLIGDAGAVCALVDPGALHVEHRPVRVELTGYARGQTIVDRRERGGEDLVHGTAGGATRVDVALDVDPARLASVFLAAIGAPSVVE